MTVRIEIHPICRGYVGGADHMTVEAATVGEALDRLVAASTFRPIMFAWLCRHGRRRPPSIVVFRNQEMLKGRYHRRPVRDGDVIRLVPMM